MDEGSNEQNFHDEINDKLNMMVLLGEMTLTISQDIGLKTKIIHAYLSVE